MTLHIMLFNILLLLSTQLTPEQCLPYTIQTQKAQQHCLIEQILSCKTLFFNIVTIISYPFSPELNSECIFFCMEEFNDSPLLHTHFCVSCHFVRLLLCCSLLHNNKIQWNIGRKFQSLPSYHQHPLLMQWANTIICSPHTSATSLYMPYHVELFKICIWFLSFLVQMLI